MDSATSPIFIVGLPRSGSTLWSRILSENSNITLFAEMHFLSPWHRDFRYVMKKTGDLSQERNVVRLIDTICSKTLASGMQQGYWFWKQIQGLAGKGLRESLYNRILDSDKKDIGTIFRLLIDEAAHCRGKKRALVKFPVYPAYLDRLIEWYPEAYIVHISRDPRALAASKTNDPAGVGNLVKRYPWAKSFLPVAGKYFAVLQYIYASHVHSKFNGMPNYHLFLYENLVSRPEQVIRELCDFCKLDFDSAMLNPSAGQASSITGKTVSGFDSSRAEGWRKVLTPRESRFIKYITSGSMQRFGYKLGG